MLDRASTFAVPETIALLRDRYVPVALDVWYEHRRQDEAGEFYRRVVSQRDGYSPEKTTQGFYVFDSQGQVAAAWNNRNPEKLRRILTRELADLSPTLSPSAASDETPAPADTRFARVPPEGGLIMKVFSKVLEARYEGEASRWDELFRSSTGRDHLWIRADEKKALERGVMTDSLLMRIVRFHLIDNTRGEPPMWKAGEVKAASLSFAPATDPAPEGSRVLHATGRVSLATANGQRSFEAELGGVLELTEEGVARFDLTAVGAFQGAGRYTGVSVPVGAFELGIAFELATGNSPSDRVPPQASRDQHGYLSTAR